MTLRYTEYQPSFTRREANFSSTVPASDTSLWGASLRQESGFFAIYEMFRKSGFEDDANFDLGAQMEKSELAKRLPGRFFGVGSEAEFRDRERLILRQYEDKAKIASSGVAGILTSMASSLFSPTILIPGGAGYRAASMGSAFRSGAAWGVVAVTGDEILLQATQSERTASESFTGIATGALLGGLVGSGAKFVDTAFTQYYSAHPEALIREVDTASLNAQTGLGERQGIIPSLEKNPDEPEFTDGVGAERVPYSPGPGDFESRWATNAAKVTNIVIRNIAQNLSPTVRQMTALLDSGSLKYENNVLGIAAAPGGDVYSRSLVWQGSYYRARKESQALFVEWLKERSTGQFARLNPKYFAEWNRLIGEAIHQQMREFDDTPTAKVDPKEMRLAEDREWPSLDTPQRPPAQYVEGAEVSPLVMRAAENWTKNFFQPFLEAAQRENLPGWKDIKNANGYITHSFKRAAIGGDMLGLEHILREHAKEFLQAEATRLQALAMRRIGQKQQEIEDLTVGKDAAEAAKQRGATDKEAAEAGRQAMLEVVAQLNAETRKAREAFGPDVANLIDTIQELRARARAVPKDTGDGVNKELRKSLSDAARKLEKENKQELADYNKAIRGLKRRRSALNQNIYNLFFEQLKVFERIEELETSSVSGMRNAIVSGQSFLQKLNTLSDEALDAELEKLFEKFTRAEELVENGAAKVEELKLRLPADASPAKVEARLLRDLPKSIVGDEPKDLISRVMRATTPEELEGFSKLRPSQGGMTLEDVKTFAKNNGFLVRSADTKLEILKDIQRRFGIDQGLFAQLLRLKLTEVRKARSLVDELYEATTKEKMREISAYMGVVIPKSRTKEQIRKELKDTLQRRFRESGGPEIQKQVAQAGRRQRMRKALEKVEAAMDMDRNAKREAVQEMLSAFSERQRIMILNKQKRIQALQVRAETMDPNQTEVRVTEAKGKIKKIQDDLFDQLFVKRGIEEIGESADGTVEFDFQRGVDDFVKSFMEQVNNADRRSPFAGQVQERGPMKRRMMKIDVNREWLTEDGRTVRYRDFLENDIDTVARRYLRSMAGDIELYKMFGSVNPSAKGSKYRNKINEEFEDARRKSALAIKAKNYPPEKEARQLRLAKEKIDDVQRDVIANLEAIVGQIRHTWGTPSNPNGILFRMARLAISANTLRLMGRVLPSSMPDLTAPILKFGVTNTFAKGWHPYIRALKNEEFKLFEEEMRFMGVALETATHARSGALAEITEDLEYGTMFERGIHGLANNMGRIALFDLWTDQVKLVTGHIANAEIMHSIRVVAGLGKVADPQEFSRAQRTLSFLNLEEAQIVRIMEQMKGEGVTKVEKFGGEVWLPNPSKWDDPEAVMVYAQAMNRYVNSTIVTPGPERPRFATETIGGRVVMQYKSFTFSSTSKTLLHGIQDAEYGFKNGDFVMAMRPILGAMGMIGLGALSFYVTAHLTGGYLLEKMQNATAGVWADEAIARSGTLGVLAEVWKLTQTVPVVGKYASFSGEQPIITPYNNLAYNLLGPTADLALNRGSGAMRAMGDVFSGEDVSSGDARDVRSIMPLQNLFYFQLMERMAGARLEDAFTE